MFRIILKKNLLRIILLIIFILFISSIVFTKDIPRFWIIGKFLETHIPENLYSIVKVIYDNKRMTKKLLNDYNTKFLPETQFLSLTLTKNPIDIFPPKENKNVLYFDALGTSANKSFYLDRYEDTIISINKTGETYYKKINKIVENKEQFTQIKNNLKLLYPLDIFIKNKNIYVSGVKEKINNCHLLVLKKGIINTDNINFNTIFESNECMQDIRSGKIQSLKLNNEDFILLSTSADVLHNNEIDPKPQDDKTIYGKILIINEKNNTYEIFSKGHRNILGLYSDNNIILSTENGPRGGDEINKIIKNKNYGWQIASYGETYASLWVPKENNDYHKSHENFGFEEPLYSFVPSIGISEIIKIDNNFSKKWQDNYLIGSLNYRHILRVKFDNNYNRLIFTEKIFIGERIRDLLYVPKEKIILLALEESGSLGILSLKK